MKNRHIIILFVDQLSLKMSSLKDIDKKNDLIVMCETTDYFSLVPHHKIKIAYQLSCMRHFYEQLKKKGFRLEVTTITKKNNSQILHEELSTLIAKHTPQKIIFTEPSEWTTNEMIKSLKRKTSIPFECREDDRFFATKEEFATYAESKKQVRMENFYRLQRQKHNILMDNKKPIGGQWNFDASNRKKLPTKISIPKQTQFKQDTITKEAISITNKLFKDHPGDPANLNYAVTHTQANKVLAQFIKERLPLFGDYQDAMATDEPWLFHSHISFYLNNGLLLASDVVNAAIKAYEENHAPINAVEGFIRQIVGWREFTRGIYWHKMPSYKKSNYFKSGNNLPNFYWTGKTNLACLSESIKNTLDNAYAHHIQRLMVLGNFTLLTECDPLEVQQWYLAVYADAYEWVEMPNVVGMILHADGGYLASKPYISSGNYINKMSNYCTNCHYDVKEKLGENACPFNYLYWNFLIKNQPLLGKNPRLAFPYRTLSKMSDQHKQLIKASSSKFMKLINN